MKNQLVADILYEIADLLDIKGEIFFKTRAYRMAAQKIEVLDEDIEVIVKDGNLQNISGIGEALAKKINCRGGFTPIPLQKLIKMQLGSILIIAEILSNNKQSD